MPYFNTNKETGDVLKSSERKVIKQEDIIADLLKNAKNLHTAAEIHAEYEAVTFTKIPRTSISRSLTNLKDKGIIIKTDTMKMGDWNKMQHTWKYNH